MAKIAVEVERALAERKRAGTPGRATGRAIAQGEGWAVRDVVCSSGPDDRPFEEQHAGVSLAIVVAGAFQYRSTTGRALLTPGSLLVGNAGAPFECAHEHAAGDRCVSFQFTPEYFETAVGAKPQFTGARIPPLPTLAPLVARAAAGLVGSAHVSWDELAIDVAGTAVRELTGRDSDDVPPNATARVSRLVRAIERRTDAALDVERLAREAGLSRYHFIRTFERVTGVTPHQYVLRARLRAAAMALSEPKKIVDVALDSGFGDVSNFNRAFRGEFGMSPRSWRAATFG